MKNKTLIFIFALFCSARLFAAELTVHAAASLTDAMTQIGAAYEKEGGHKVQFNFAASSLLARQIEGGAPADLFLSADEAKMDGLEKKGLLLGGTRHSLLSNSLVIVVANDARSTPASARDLTRPQYKKIALAEPHSVPAGIYAREYLQKLKLWGALQEKLVPTESVRSALAAVASGNVDAGFVYKTDALISKKVRVALEIPADEGPQISYSVAVIKSSGKSGRANKFEDYLFGLKAHDIFTKFGFTVQK